MFFFFWRFPVVVFFTLFKNPHKHEFLDTKKKEYSIHDYPPFPRASRHLLLVRSETVRLVLKNRRAETFWGTFFLEVGV